YAFRKPDPYIRGHPQQNQPLTDLQGHGPRWPCPFWLSSSDLYDDRTGYNCTPQALLSDIPPKEFCESPILPSNPLAFAGARTLVARISPANRRGAPQRTWPPIQDHPYPTASWWVSQAKGLQLADIAVYLLLVRVAMLSNRTI